MDNPRRPTAGLARTPCPARPIRPSPALPQPPHRAPRPKCPARCPHPACLRNRQPTRPCALCRRVPVQRRRRRYMVRPPEGRPSGRPLPQRLKAVTRHRCPRRRRPRLRRLRLPTTWLLRGRRPPRPNGAPRARTRCRAALPRPILGIARRPKQRIRPRLIRPQPIPRPPPTIARCPPRRRPMPRAQPPHWAATRCNGQATWADKRLRRRTTPPERQPTPTAIPSWSLSFERSWKRFGIGLTKANSTKVCKR